MRRARWAHLCTFSLRMCFWARIKKARRCNGPTFDVHAAVATRRAPHSMCEPRRATIYVRALRRNEAESTQQGPQASCGPLRAQPSTCNRNRWDGPFNSRAAQGDVTGPYDGRNVSRAATRRAQHFTCCLRRGRNNSRAVHSFGPFNPHAEQAQWAQQTETMHNNARSWSCCKTLAHKKRLWLKQILLYIADTNLGSQKSHRLK